MVCTVDVVLLCNCRLKACIAASSLYCNQYTKLSLQSFLRHWFFYRSRSTAIFDPLCAVSISCRYTMNVIYQVICLMLYCRIPVHGFACCCLLGYWSQLQLHMFRKVSLWIITISNRLYFPALFISYELSVIHTVVSVSWSFKSRWNNL